MSDSRTLTSKESIYRAALEKIVGLRGSGGDIALAALYGEGTQHAPSNEWGGVETLLQQRNHALAEVERLRGSDETGALHLPDDPQQLLVTTARDAGFSETQWKAMFYEQGPYDVTFPCFTTKKFIALLLERLQQPSAQKVTRCPHCNDTGWTETPDVYPDGSVATSRRCPRGCSSVKANDQHNVTGESK